MLWDMSHHAVLLAQLKLARAQKIARAAELTCVLKLAEEKVAIVSKVLNFARGALGAGAKLPANRAADQLKTLAGKAKGMSVVPGSPEAKALQQSGAVGLRRNTIPLEANGRMPEFTGANAKRVDQALQKRFPTQGQVTGRPVLPPGTSPGAARAANQRFNQIQNATALENMHQQAMIPANWITRQAMPQGMANQLARLGRKAQAGKARQAPGLAAHAAGAKLNPALKQTAQVGGAAAGIGAAGAGLGLRLPALLSPNLFKQASLREKIAARIINADVGLDDIIAHIKNAKVKRAGAALPAPPPQTAVPLPGPGNRITYPGARPHRHARPAAPKPSPYQQDTAGIP